MTEEVRAAEKAAYEKLIRMVAHEVGNSVAASSSLLQSSLSYSRHIPDADRSDFEDAVGVCLARLSTLNGFVRDLAEVVRLPEPRLQPCDLASLLRGSSLLLRASASKADVDWGLEIEDPLPPVLADRAQIEQAFINIAKNAIEAAGAAGQVRVRARAEGSAVAVASVDTPNPATSGHLKTGHHGSGRDVFILGLTCCRSSSTVAIQAQG